MWYHIFDIGRTLTETLLGTIDHEPVLDVDGDGQIIILQEAFWVWKGRYEQDAKYRFGSPDIV